MTDECEQKSQAFLSWLTSLPGVTISPKIQLADYRERGAGRGVKAIQDIDEDEDLFNIPRASILAIENSDLKERIPELSNEEGPEPWLSLTLVMIYEYLRGDESHWKPYFSILPSNFNTLMFWSPEELKELQASAVLNKIGKKETDEMFAKELLPLIRQNQVAFKAESLSDEDLGALAHRMGSIIMAYAFDLEKEDEDTEADWDDDETEALSPKGLVPLADMLNADAESNASLFYEPTALTMKSLRPIPAGTEILNDYGQLPRSDLLRRYGYITPLYTRYDCVEINRDWLDATLTTHQKAHLSRVLTDEENEKRREYLAENHCIGGEEGFDIVWPENSENMDFFPDDLSRYVKTMVADDAEGPGTPWKKVAKTGMSDDALMKRFEGVMLEVVTSRMQEYATTLKEDLELLDKPSTQGRLRTAIEVRVGEKQILKEAEARIRRKQGRSAEDEPASKRRRVE